MKHLNTQKVFSAKSRIKKFNESIWNADEDTMMADAPYDLAREPYEQGAPEDAGNFMDTNEPVAGEDDPMLKFCPQGYFDEELFRQSDIYKIAIRAIGPEQTEERIQFFKDKYPQ